MTKKKKVVSLEKEKAKKQKNTNNRFLIKATVIILLLVGVLFFIVSKSKIKEVNIVGSIHYTDEEITKMLDVEVGSTLLESFLRKDKSEKYLPFIDTIDITYSSFNSILVEVKEKAITSYIPFQTQYLALDKDGYIVGYENNMQNGIPISRGLKVKEAVVGNKISIEESVLDSILVIHNGIQKYNIGINEINFENGKYDNIHLYIDEIDIFLGDTNDIDKKLDLVSKAIEKLPSGSKGTLDLSKGSEFYIFKNDFELLYYIKNDEGFNAIDKDYVIKKISYLKFNDSVTVYGVDNFVGEVGKVADISDQDKNIIDTVLNRYNYLNKKPNEIHINYENRGEIATKIGNFTFILGKLEDIDARIDESLRFYNEHIFDETVGTVDMREIKAEYKVEKQKLVD